MRGVRLRRLAAALVAIGVTVTTVPAPALAVTEQALTVPYQAPPPANIDFTVTPNPTPAISAQRGGSAMTDIKIKNTGTVPIRILARAVFPSGVSPDEYNTTGFRKDYTPGTIPNYICPGSPNLSGNAAAVVLQLGYGACVYPGVNTPVEVLSRLDPGQETGVLSPDLRVVIALPNNYDTTFPRNGEFQIVFTAEEVQ